MLRIAVIDDEETFTHIITKRIQTRLTATNTSAEIDSFTDSTQMLQSAAATHYDLVFLDIDMPEITGIDIAKKLRMWQADTEVVFCTNKDELVYDTIQYSPFRFIRKSRFDKEIDEALDTYLEKRNAQTMTTVFLTDDGKKTVKTAEIRYIEVKSHKLTVHMADDMFMANGNLSDVESEISGYGFIRIHKGYLVNFRYIHLIHQKEIRMDDGTLLPLSRQKLAYTQKELMRFSREL